MIDFSTQLENKMEERNFHINGKINYNISGKWQRFSDGLKKYKRKKDLFVILHGYDRGATFGDWHYPDDWFTYWNTENGRPSRDDLLERENEKKIRLMEQRYEREKSEWRSRKFFHKFYCHDAENHPYVIKKKIIPYQAKQVRSWLLVPIRDIDYNLKTLQIIKPDGFKRLWKGTSFKNNMIWLSEELSDDYSGVIRVCEGYATGCTIHQVTKSPVVCAISANNLLETSLNLRRKFQNANIKICADNDEWGSENIGLKYAGYAARYTGCALHYPIFDRLDCSLKPTDFNDLMVLSDNKEVKRQLILIRN